MKVIHKGARNKIILKDKSAARAAFSTMTYKISHSYLPMFNEIVLSLLLE